MKLQPDTEARFWAKVDKSGECWQWTGARSPNGYGSIGIAYRTRSAHRLSYEMAYGTIPEGLHICHRCDNRSCVKPDHLFAGTRSDNMRDCAAKGRIRGGGDPGKLTRAQRIEAVRRVSAGQMQLAVAKAYGISPQAMSHLVKCGRYGLVEAK